MYGYLILTRGTSIMKNFLKNLSVIALVLTFQLSQPIQAFATEFGADNVVTDNSVAAVAPITVDPETGKTVITAASTVVDLHPLVTEIAIFAALALALGASFFFKWLSKKFGIDKYFTAEQYQRLVSPILDEAIAYGVSKLSKADWLKVDTKNDAVNKALQYALEHAGPLLAKLGITETMLKQKLEAKLVANGWTLGPAVSSAPVVVTAETAKVTAPGTAVTGNENKA